MNRLLICLTVMLPTPLTTLHAATYHVDSIAGNDSNGGGSPAEAWRTLEKVNATRFQPGDTLLLKSGSTWVGCLHPKGSGSATKRIVLDRYGDGPQPIIHGGGIAGGAVLLQDQQYWTIRNLEITNHGSKEPRKAGILIRNNSIGARSSIAVEDRTIHDVTGEMADYKDGKESGGSSLLFQNNIFINAGTGTFPAPQGCRFMRNIYFGSGHIAEDARKILGDPRLLAPGSGGLGLGSVAGYKLGSGSPAVNAGLLIPDHGGRDYWGNPVSASAPTHLGTYQGAPVQPGKEQP